MTTTHEPKLTDEGYSVLPDDDRYESALQASHPDDAYTLEGSGSGHAHEPLELAPHYTSRCNGRGAGAPDSSRAWAWQQTPHARGKLSGHRLRSSSSAVIGNSYKYRSADPAVSPRV